MKLVFGGAALGQPRYSRETEAHRAAADAAAITRGASTRRSARRSSEARGVVTQ